MKPFSIYTRFTFSQWNSPGIALSSLGIMRKRLRCRAKSLLFWLAASVCGYFVYTRVFPIDIDVRSDVFHRQSVCPACYGENLCPELQSGRLTLTNWTRRTVSKVFNAKNVFLADLTVPGLVDSASVVLKKLGHDNELDGLDRRICETAGQRADYCHPGHYVKYLASNNFALHRKGDKTLDFQVNKALIRIIENIN